MFKEYTADYESIRKFMEEEACMKIEKGYGTTNQMSEDKTGYNQIMWNYMTRKNNLIQKKS